MERGEYDEAAQGARERHGRLRRRGPRRALVKLKREHPDGPLGEAADALLKGDTEAGLQGLMTALEQAEDDELKDQIRKAMVGVFTELGSDHPLTREYRRKLAAALY